VPSLNIVHKARLSVFNQSLGKKKCLFGDLFASMRNEHIQCCLSRNTKRFFDNTVRGTSTWFEILSGIGIGATFVCVISDRDFLSKMRVWWCVPVVDKD
jgi:hypothetical protein